MKITVIQALEWKLLKAQPGRTEQNKPKPCFQSMSKLTWNKEIHTLNKLNETSYWNQSFTTLIHLSVHWKILKWDRKHRVQDSQNYKHSMDPDIYIWMLSLATKTCNLYEGFCVCESRLIITDMELGWTWDDFKGDRQNMPGTKFTPQTSSPSNMQISGH